MAELDELWREVHDAEARLGRAEGEIARINALAKFQSMVASDRRWLIATVIALVEAVAIVLQATGVI